MVQEIHSAQRKREESMMGRMKLNSQEKEEALRRLRELERRLDEYVLFCCPLCNLLTDKFIISRVSHIYYICLALIYIFVFSMFQGLFWQHWPVRFWWPWWGRGHRGERSFFYMFFYFFDMPVHLRNHAILKVHVHVILKCVEFNVRGIWHRWRICHYWVFSVMKWNTEAGSHLFINIISSSFEDSSRV